MVAFQKLGRQVNGAVCSDNNRFPPCIGLPLKKAAWQWFPLRAGNSLSAAGAALFAYGGAPDESLFHMDYNTLLPVKQGFGKAGAFCNHFVI